MEQYNRLSAFHLPWKKRWEFSEKCNSPHWEGDCSNCCPAGTTGISMQKKSAPGHQNWHHFVACVLRAGLGASLCFEFWLIRCTVLKRSKWLTKAINLGSSTAKWKLLNHPWWLDTCSGCRLRANAQNKGPWFRAFRVFNIVPVKFSPSCNNFTAWLKRPCLFCKIT